MAPPNILVNSEGKTWTQYPILREKEVVTAYTVSHSAPDPTGSGIQHQVVIDATAPNLDKAHIYLSGNPASDEFFIRCKNPALYPDHEGMSEVFWVDGDGNMKCNSIISAQFNNHEGLVISNGERIGVQEMLMNILEPHVGALLADVIDIETNIDEVESEATSLGSQIQSQKTIQNYLLEHVGYVPDLLELSSPSKSIVGEIVALHGMIQTDYNTSIVIGTMSTEINDLGIQVNNISDSQSGLVDEIAKFNDYDANWGFSNYSSSAQVHPHENYTFYAKTAAQFQTFDNRLDTNLASWHTFEASATHTLDLHGDALDTNTDLLLEYFGSQNDLTSKLSLVESTLETALGKFHPEHEDHTNTLETDLAVITLQLTQMSILQTQHTGAFAIVATNHIEDDLEFTQIGLTFLNVDSDILHLNDDVSDLKQAFSNFHDKVLFDANGWNVSEWGWIGTENVVGDSDTQTYNLGFAYDVSMARVLKNTYVELEKLKYHIGSFTEYSAFDHAGIKFITRIRARVTALEGPADFFLNGATPDATPNTLAYRNNDGDCNFNVIRSFASVSESSFVIRKDGHFIWLTENNAGARRTAGSWDDSSVTVQSIYRFGRDHQNLQAQYDDPGIWDFSGELDGLHIEDNGQLCTIHTDNNTPTLFLGGYKANSTIPIIECSLPALILGEADTGPTTVFYVSGSEVYCRETLVCKNLKSTDGGGIFSTFEVKNLITGGDSVWLGNRLHVTESGGAQLRLRSDTIPKYLQDLSPAVVVGDLSTDIEDVPLSEFVTLSEARGGSADLSVIFDKANAHLDFEVATRFNEVIIEPINAGQEDSGLIIRNELGGHPTLNFEGSSSEGRGLIQFKDVEESGNVSLIYNSKHDDGLHIDTNKDLFFDCADINIVDSSTDIIRNSVGVFAKLAELEAASSGGSSLEITSSDTTPAKIVISNTHASQFDGSVALEFEMNHANEVYDYTFRAETDAYDLAWRRIQHPSSTNAVKEQLRFCGSGHVVIAGGTTANASAWDGGHPSGTILLGRVQLINELQFNPTFHTVPASESAAGDEGLLSVDETGIYYRTSSKWVRAPLLDFEHSFDPVPVRNTVHLNPGQYYNYPQLADNCTSFMHDATGATDMSRYRLPNAPKDGMLIHVFKARSEGTIEFHTGATVDGNGTYRMQHPSSVGKSGNYVSNITVLGKYTANFILATNQWLIL